MSESNLAVALLSTLASFAVAGVSFAKAIERSGHSKWWTFLMLIPVAGLLFMCIFLLKMRAIKRDA